MKPITPGSLSDWFGYTRRERRASFILLLIIATVAGIRYMIPNREMNIEIIPVAYPILTTESDTAERALTLDQKSQLKKIPGPAGMIDLNKCDSADLESLRGLGPVLSARIIRYRNLLGGFADVSQLREVYGLPEETYNIVSGILKADPADVLKINVNNADYKQLIRMPYLERYDVISVLKYRELMGRIDGIQELVANGILSKEKAAKVNWYLKFEEAD